MKILVKLRKDYADEFDCKMFAIYEAESIEDLSAKLVAAAETLAGREIYFGTNEYIEVDPSDFSLTRPYGGADFIPLTDDEAEIITVHLGRSWGTGNQYFDYLPEI